MSCVNTKSKEFKECAKRLNLSEETLEFIVHKFQNTEGNENIFPSDDYVKSTLDGISTITTSNTLIELWNSRYKNPIIINSREEGLKVYNEALKYFDNSSISFYKDKSNKYVLRVAKPYKISVQENRLVGNLLQELKKSKWVEKINKIEDVHGAVRKEYGVYSVTLGKILRNENSEVIKAHITDLIEKLGLPLESFNIESRKSDPRIVDITVKDDIISKDSFSTTITSGKELKILHDFLKERLPGIGNIYSISSEEALKMGISKATNAFTLNGDTYIIGNRGNLQIASEEALHPLLNYVQEVNSSLFNSLLEEAKKTFPTLYAEIEFAYKEMPQSTRDNELVTQALSRYFANDFKNTQKEQRASFKDVVNKFFSYIADTLNKFFDNYHVDAKYLPNMTLKELSQLLNTKDSKWEIKIQKGIQENKVLDNSKYLQEQTKFTEQIDNLLGSAILKASEVRHVALEAVYWISDHITDMMEHPENIKDYYGVDLDITGKSRAEVVNAIGVDNIVNKAKEQFKRSDFKKRSTLKKAKVIRENWEALMKIASYEFANIEDFAIVRGADGNLEVTTEINADADNFNESNKSEEVAETEGNIQEHWQIENRTLDIMTSMSQIIRQELTKCYVLEQTGIDESGNPIYDNKKSEFGINERINARDAVNSILRWTQGSITMEDMISKLRNKSKDNPWLSQIITKLSDISGKYSDFQSQFFSVFNKHFQSYSIVLKKDGTYTSIPVNEHPALNDAYNSITTQFKIGEHPLFGINGVNQEAFKSFEEAHNELQTLRKKPFDENKDSLIENITYISGLLGYYVTREIVESSINSSNIKQIIDAVSYMHKSISDSLNDPNYNPFKFGGKGSIGGNVKRFLSPITDKLEDVAVSSFYDSGKMYQSYVTPSYMTKLMQKFKLEGKDFDDFIQSEYGKYTWFKEQTGDIETGWRNVWLDKLTNDNSAKEVFAHKVQLNFNKRNYMRNMNDTEYTLSLIAEYFFKSKDDKNPDRTPAWFRIPMLSNKPSSEFIKFYSYRADNYKQSIVEGFKKIFYQELSRIQTVEMRGYDKKDPRFIKNFDTNGKKFMFLDFMNDYLSGKKQYVEVSDANNNIERINIHSLLRNKLDGKSINEEQLNRAVKHIIYTNMEDRANKIINNWGSQGIIKAAEKIENVGHSHDEVVANLENFIWNDAFASMNIMQLTITDIAYYKDAEDLQKRLAQIHAPGIRANIDAIDYEGNKVTDGKIRTFYLKDFDTFKSNIKENVAIVFDRKIKSAPENQKEILKSLKESILRDFDKINVADAQGYSSPTSYRKKALLFGKWSKEAETIYQKLKSGKYTYDDLKTAFQPLKPFVYTQSEKPSGVEEAPMEILKVPIQNKNSEYLLIMADAILQNENTGRPNLLRAIFEVMENSTNKDNTKGIDTVQFESTVKSGLMGAIDINQYIEDPNGEEKAKSYIESLIYNEKDYSSTYVHEIPVEDYCIQQEVPEHFKEHQQAHGSQIRYIIPSDLETLDYEGNPITYKVGDREFTAEGFKEEYENTIAENIRESITNLQTELGLTSMNKIERNIALSKILQREILSSPRYGVDLLQACSLNENGEFRIPLGDPIQAKRVEQLINSIIKNRVNKQEIAGGPVVQVTNYGTSQELNIRFKDKKGNLLSTRKEYKGTDAEYKKYIEENQAGIAYFEVFAPIYSNKLAMFSDEKGNINMEAIEMLDPDLLKMIGYRIPTEDKYSMAPLKIVGFLPREAGDGIMLPNDITLLTGSDFDVDKEYLMRKDIGINKINISKSKLHNILYNEKLKNNPNLDYKERRALTEEINIFLDSPFRKGNDKELLKLYIQNAFTIDKPREGKAYRDNKIIDMTYAVLTHETTTDKMLNPGGFEPQKRMGYMVEAYRNSDKYTWEELQSMDTDDLKKVCYTDKNLSYIDTHIQFYKQNAAAGVLIGTFAVHKVAHAVLESNGYKIDIEELCGRNFNIAGIEFADKMTFDDKYDVSGQLIGKSLGNLVASAVDAVKDPILNLMNINGNTSSILTSLVRLGMPFDTAALFLSQKVISDVLTQYNNENTTGKKSLNDIVQEKIDSLDIEDTSVLDLEKLSYNELVTGLKKNKTEIDYKILKAFQDIQKIASALRGPTFATRFNSISSAVGPLIVDNLMIEHKMTQFSEFIYGPNNLPIGLRDILEKHPILNEFSKTVNIAKELFGNMPANSNGFRKILNSISSSTLSNILFGDRKLLSQLSDFYQSYLLMASGTVKESDLNYYINNFPTEFFKNNFKEKYPDNLLIQSIKLDVNDTTGRAILKVDITGLDTSQKEALSSAWIDLHKENAELSTKLFMYNFFRGGIGFNPKTFMGLVPTYVKERIIGYLDTYKKLPSVSPAVVINQFIRNNADNPSLVPTKKDLHFSKVNEKMIRIEGNQVDAMSKVPYFKIIENSKEHVYALSISDKKYLLYKEITPLGNNKEYLEISNTYIDTPLNLISFVVETDSDNSINSSLQEEDIETPKRTKQELSELAYSVIENKYGDRAQEKISKMKSMTAEEKSKYETEIKGWFKGQFDKLNVEYDQNTIDEVYNLFC